MKSESGILIDVEKYVQQVLTRELPSTRYFHNLAHTQSVARRCDEIASFYQLPNDEKINLLLAAWFHDTGYCVAQHDHELRSAEIMNKFLQDHFSEQQIKKISSIILATKMPVHPSCLAEQIICDADLYHLGSVHYFKWAYLLKLEIEHYHHTGVSEDTWLRENISFFSKHTYHTGYANTHWLPQKELNLRAMQHALKASYSQPPPSDLYSPMTD